MLLLEGNGHVVGVRWQTLVQRDGGRGAAVEGAGKIDVVGVLEQHLVLPARREGGGRGGMEVWEGRVVN